MSLLNVKYFKSRRYSIIYAAKLKRKFSIFIMEISNEKFGMLLKEAASEVARRSGISVARVLIGEGIVGSTSALS